ncbi:type IX secretion system sortase PorU [uncultured Bacteroides sp.]|uniref:type IX secretion system sortase PorU n=1 Tax=uncultured Bacteroides sp. TaxID=162156 RepID=UPI002AAA8C2F|nr:type IX secretion system sortase PorU [uncultured Bacteroides sp.]
MCSRNYLFFLLIFLFALPISAQDFTSLKWQNSSVAQQLTFDDAHFSTGSQLPRYIQNIDLGADYANYTYNVKIEYPEFQTLTKSEASFVVVTKETLHSYPKADTRLFVSAKKGILEVSFVPLVYLDNQYQRINSFKLTLEKIAVKQKRSSSNLHDFTKSSKLASGKWVKIRVSESGIFKMTNVELAKMGFTNPAKVRLYGYGGYLLPESFKKSNNDDLPQIPLWREKDYVLFYANGVVRWDENTGVTCFTHVNNHYSSSGYYFLTEGDDEPLTFPVEGSVTSDNASTVTSFDDYVLYEKDAFNWTSSGRELYDSYDYVAGNTKSYSFTLPGITNEKAYCTVAFAAKSTNYTNVAVQINNTGIGQFSIASCPESDFYCKAQPGNGTFAWEGDKSEKTTVTLTHTRESGASGRLDYIQLNYRRKLALYDSFTAFRDLSSVNKVSTYTISGANSNMKVWDITTPGGYKQINGSLSSGNYSFTVNNSSLREFVAVDVTGSNFKKVEVVGTVNNQNLHALGQCDMAIIVPSNGDFLTQAERLADIHRTKDGMTVHVVTADQVYNEFSSGTPDATAYRWFMKMFYDRAVSSETGQVAENKLPRYLLLFGDCAWDNRMITSSWQGYSPDDFLLGYQSKNSTWETYSYVTDDYQGLLDDEDGSSLEYDGMDIGVGRFPVRTVTQATQMVDKTIAYIQNKELGPWKNSICFVADDGDNHLHMSQADELATKVETNYPEFLANRIYADSYKWETTATGHTYKLATKRLLELFNEGMLMVNYTGHGGPNGWSAENILVSSDIMALRSPKLPLWVTATCDFCRYDDVTTSAGELAFLNDQGGAIALFTTSRVVYAQNNSSLNKVFCNHVFSKQDGKRLRLGDIMRLSKCDSNLSGDLNKLKFSLIGDPALMLAYPDYKLVVDKFNGKDASSSDLAIKAGGKVKVEGRVTDTDGNTLTDFYGKVYPTVFDNKETVTTLNNDGTGMVSDLNNPGESIPGGFTFSQRTKKLFSGSDSIKAGNFSFTFPVPKDINYSNKQGLVNFYAAETATTREAQGSFSNFVIGGTESGTEVTDSLGPKINLYLNTPDFVYGGRTNETPYLVAELEDKDGINTVGNGIGHDIVAVIDNSPNYTYVLNNYYEAYFGDYTQGTVHYSLPALPQGKHTLFFRAWDIMNNSSSTSLEFEVVNGLKPGLFNVYCSKSPARDNTTFVLSHDRPEKTLDVKLIVYDFSGREMWTHTEVGMSANNYYYVDWNLTSNGGQRLAPGVYLFRASIASGGSEESTRSGKIVILTQ